MVDLLISECAAGAKGALWQHCRPRHDNIAWRSHDWPLRFGGRESEAMGILIIGGVVLIVIVVAMVVSRLQD